MRQLAFNDTDMAQQDKRPTCLSCPWFKPRTEEQKERFVPGWGYCDVTLPPHLNGLLWGKGNTRQIEDPQKQVCVFHPEMRGP